MCEIANLYNKTYMQRYTRLSGSDGVRVEYMGWPDAADLVVKRKRI